MELEKKSSFKKKWHENKQPESIRVNPPNLQFESWTQDNFIKRKLKQIIKFNS